MEIINYINTINSTVKNPPLHIRQAQGQTIQDFSVRLVLIVIIFHPEVELLLICNPIVLYLLALIRQARLSSNNPDTLTEMHTAQSAQYPI